MDPVMSIKAQVSLDEEIRDKRQITFGMSFGTIFNLIQQYSIYVEQDGENLIFTAPRSRLRMFAEKLHFGDISFYEA